MLSTSTGLDDLTGTELNAATSAVTLLLSDKMRPHISDGVLVAKLSSLRDDLEGEQSERRRIAKGARVVSRGAE